ncbi:MAG: cytochrome c oxidase subunit 3 [Bacteroidia bacterium]|nr:cytochrome c oxidase subunit 3 [Bacteroidia bacterium]
MTQSFKTKQANTPEYAINPTKFVLWLLIVASIMLFAAFTSAYIVRRGEGNWLIFELPSLFMYSTAIIAASSIAMQWAFMAAKKDNLTSLKTGLGITLALGIAFAISQWFAWKQLVANNIHLVGNPSESFVYIISGVHLLHMLGGLVFLLIVLVKTFQYKVHKKNLLTINLCTTYWHFLGLVWVYLYFFFTLNR